MMSMNESAPIEGPFRLYGCWRSTCTHRAILALRFHDIDFHYSPIDLTAREQEQPEFLAISPDAQVPVLAVGDRVLTQSLAIVSFIDSIAESADTKPGAPALFPAEPATRAHALSICERVSSFIQPMTLPGAIRRSIQSHFSRADDAIFSEQAKGFIEAMLTDNLRKLDGVFARHSGPFALGQAVSVADVFVYPQLLGAQRMGFDLAPFARLSSQTEAMARLAFVKAADPLALPDAP